MENNMEIVIVTKNPLKNSVLKAVREKVSEELALARQEGLTPNSVTLRDGTSGPNSGLFLTFSCDGIDITLYKIMGQSKIYIGDIQGAWFLTDEAQEALYSPNDVIYSTYTAALTDLVSRTKQLADRFVNEHDELTKLLEQARQAQTNHEATNASVSTNEVS